MENYLKYRNFKQKGLKRFESIVKVWLLQPWRVTKLAHYYKTYLLNLNVLIAIGFSL